jgi:hypothetical protein
LFFKDFLIFRGFGGDRVRSYGWNGYDNRNLCTFACYFTGLACSMPFLIKYFYFTNKFALPGFLPDSL